MACSLCGGYGHNIRTCQNYRHLLPGGGMAGPGGVTPTIPQAYQPPPEHAPTSPPGPAYAPPRHAQRAIRGPSPSLIALIVLAGLVQFAVCVSCLTVAIRPPESSAPPTKSVSVPSWARPYNQPPAAPPAAVDPPIIEPPPPAWPASDPPPAGVPTRPSGGSKCCDGSWSPCSHKRGCCSHHGGVCG